MYKNLSEECLFCKIIAGLEKACIIYEDNHFIAFLDKRPLFLGHSLLLPKAHVPTLYDLADHAIKPFFSLLKRMGEAVENAMGADGSFIAINNTVSQSIPHMHFHVIPRKKGDGLRGFFWPRQHYTSEEQMHQIQQKISEQLELIPR